MGDYRSRSYNDGNMQIEPYEAPRSTIKPSNLRCYSTSYTPPQGYAPPPQKLKKGRSSNGSALKSWSLNDPEFQRKRRVASYKVYSVEGKIKGSVRKSFRWLKDRYTHIVYGWWWLIFWEKQRDDHLFFWVNLDLRSQLVWMFFFFLRNYLFECTTLMIIYKYLFWKSSLRVEVLQLLLIW